MLLVEPNVQTPSAGYTKSIIDELIVNGIDMLSVLLPSYERSDWRLSLLNPPRRPDDRTGMRRRAACRRPEIHVGKLALRSIEIGFTHALRTPPPLLTILHESTIAPCSKSKPAMSMYPPWAAKNKAVVPVCKCKMNANVITST